MYSTDDTGPAFPTPGDEMGQDGMTIRTWLAGLAMQGLLSARGLSAEETAKAAVDCADALLARLEKGVD